MKTKQLAYCSIFLVIIIIGAFIRIPIPMIPFTLQFFAICMAGNFLGAKKGLLCTVTYMLLGLFGVPIFTQGGGFSYVLKPSFGYIFAFNISVLIIGTITHYNKKSFSLKKVFFANVLGMIVTYVIGMTYFYFICNFVIDAPTSIKQTLVTLGLLLAPGDIICCFLSALLVKRIGKYVKIN